MGAGITPPKIHATYQAGKSGTGEGKNGGGVNWKEAERLRYCRRGLAQVQALLLRQLCRALLFTRLPLISKRHELQARASTRESKPRTLLGLQI
ncbi:hypothetical protein DYU05_10945 [Mucilaginibacter terrenus]|uniref:Uncharacterized protein n=1 Tax=Mucilaginibacter terrenus TaxID=2482727 RepID=A0A3E2NNW2_9SPHI|nr:hypothetical protein DYU05_10945 [Mucilaginibacter terrenus]